MISTEASDGLSAEGLEWGVLWREAEAGSARLMVVLEAEFEALKRQDLASFEAGQAEKIALLEQLVAYAEQIRTDVAGTERSRRWEDFKDTIRRCHDAHRRNEDLIQRQLTAIRGALQALDPQDASHTLEMYDRLGRVTRRHGARDYSGA